MTPEDARGAAAGRLAQAGFDVEGVRLGVRDTVVARTSEFRWRWMATRLHSFVVLVVAEPGDGRSELDVLLADAATYADTNREGLPGGLQTGTGVIVVVFGAGAGDDVRGWASQPHGRRFAVITWPVVADTTTRTITQPARMRMGGVYVPYFRELMRNHVAAVLDGPA